MISAVVVAVADETRRNAATSVRTFELIGVTCYETHIHTYISSHYIHLIHIIIINTHF